MKYDNITEGEFVSRPNRFIANVLINGKNEVCHVKNTGRCRELLQAGAKVILTRSDNPARKTRYDLVAVYKNDILINMDSMAPNKAVHEWLAEGGMGEFTRLCPEHTIGDSRFDFYGEIGERRIVIEVKGVTLENEGIVRFPDAPTERGAKHLSGLIRLASEGYEAYAFFVVQMKGMKYFTPNRDTDPVFSDMLVKASESGVHIICRQCDVFPDGMTICEPLEIRLKE